MTGFSTSQDLFAKLSKAFSKNSSDGTDGILSALNLLAETEGGGAWNLGDFAASVNPGAFAPGRHQDGGTWNFDNGQSLWDRLATITQDELFFHEDGPYGGGMKPEDAVLVDSGFLAGGEGDGLGGPAVSAPAMLTDMADFLVTDFWTQFGTVPREFNLTGSGTNFKSGVLHYNVTGFSNAGSAGTDTNGISAARADLVRDVLDIYSEVLGITFVETTSSDTNFTDIFFKDNDSGAYANSAGFSDGIQYSWINVAASWSGGTSTYNDYTLQTIFHEMGHALGLGHQGLYNGTGTYPSDADFENDSWQATMMSYFSQTENTTINADFAFLQTPMAVDWIALEDIYGDQSFGGTNFGIGNAFLGDTVYGFNTNISSTTSNIWAEFSNYADLTASTIIDAGGTDTLDFSGYNATQLINLTPTSQFNTAPSISNIGGLIGNLTLAEGTIIENAIGGSGNDTFFGNSVANILTGNAGDDYFNDSDGNDTYYGGADTDTVSFLGNFADYAFSVVGNFLEAVNSFTDLVEDTIEWLAFDDQTLSYQDVVNSISGAPDAQDDAFTTAESSTVGGDLFADNGNGADSDPEGDPFTITAVNGSGANVGVQFALVSGALVTVNANGTFSYDPNGVHDGLFAGQTAVDSFTYTIDDGIDGTDTATVNITVNGEGMPPPSLSIDDVSAAEGDSGVTTFTFTVTRSGDTSGTSSVTVTTADDTATAGSDYTALAGTLVNFAAGVSTETVTVSVTGDTTVESDETFFVNLSGASGATIADGQGMGTIQNDDVPPSTPVLIDFESAPLGSYPGEAGLDFSGLTVVSGTQLSGSQNGLSGSSGFTITASGQDFDLDSVELRAKNGKKDVTINAWDDGVIVGTFSIRVEKNTTSFINFDASFDSVDFVDFSSNGEIRADDIAVVTFSGPVNQPPAATDNAYTTAENAIAAGNLITDDTGNGVDSDPEADPLTMTSVDGDGDGTANLASGAIVTFNSDGSFNYDPNGAFDGLFDGQTDTDTFTYEIDDGNGNTDTGSVTMTITGVGTPPNQPPTATDNAYTTAENAIAAGNLITDDTGNGVDSDPEADPLTMTSIDGDGDGTANLASGAIVTFNSDGTFNYDPNGAFDGLFDGQTDTDTFTYEIDDGNGNTDTGSVTMTITGVGTPPGPTLVEVNFEAGSLTEDGFTVSNATISSQNPGTVGLFSAYQANRTSPMVIERADSAAFDFDAGVFTNDDNRARTLTVEGFLDGVSVGVQTFNLDANVETSLSLSDGIFDNVDRVELDTNGRSFLFIDELDFFI